MITIRNLMLAIVLVFGLAFATNAQVPPQQNPQNPTTQPRQDRQQNQTPKEITDYIGKHFPRATVQNAKENNGAYEVDLSGGTHLKFDRNNEITSIRSSSELPESVIPGNIHTYMNSNHKNKKIRSWEKTGNQQKLKLDDDTELTFDSEGNFVR